MIHTILMTNVKLCEPLKNKLQTDEPVTTIVYLPNFAGSIKARDVAAVIEDTRRAGLSMRIVVALDIAQELPRPDGIPSAALEGLRRERPSEWIKVLYPYFPWTMPVFGDAKIVVERGPLRLVPAMMRALGRDDEGNPYHNACDFIAAFGGDQGVDEEELEVMGYNVHKPPNCYRDPNTLRWHHLFPKRAPNPSEPSAQEALGSFEDGPTRPSPFIRVTMPVERAEQRLPAYAPFHMPTYWTTAGQYSEHMAEMNRKREEEALQRLNEEERAARQARQAQEWDALKRRSEEEWKREMSKQQLAAERKMEARRMAQDAQHAVRTGGGSSPYERIMSDIRESTVDIRESALQRIAGETLGVREEGLPMMIVRVPPPTPEEEYAAKFKAPSPAEVDAAVRAWLGPIPSMFALAVEYNPTDPCRPRLVKLDFTLAADPSKAVLGFRQLLRLDKDGYHLAKGEVPVRTDPKNGITPENIEDVVDMLRDRAARLEILVASVRIARPDLDWFVEPVTCLEDATPCNTQRSQHIRVPGLVGVCVGRSSSDPAVHWRVNMMLFKPRHTGSWQDFFQVRLGIDEPSGCARLPGTTWDNTQLHAASLMDLAELLPKVVKHTMGVHASEVEHEARRYNRMLAHCQLP